MKSKDNSSKTEVKNLKTCKPQTEDSASVSKTSSTDFEIKVPKSKNTIPDAINEKVNEKDTVSNKNVDENTKENVVKENKSVNKSIVGNTIVQTDSLNKANSKSLYPISEALKEAYTALGYHDKEFL